MGGWCVDDAGGNSADVDDGESIGVVLLIIIVDALWECNIDADDDDEDDDDDDDADCALDGTVFFRRQKLQFHRSLSLMKSGLLTIMQLKWAPLLHELHLIIFVVLVIVRFVRQSEQLYFGCDELRDE